MSKEKLVALPVVDIGNKPEFSLNGESITLELIAPRGERFPIQIDRASLAKLTQRVTYAYLTAERVAATQGGHAEMQALEAEHASAQWPIGSAHVVLTAKLHTPLIQHFALSPTQADTLASELQTAADQAREHTNTSRH